MFEQQESKFIVAIILSNIFILSIQAFKELLIWYGNPTVLGLLLIIVPLYIFYKLIIFGWNGNKKKGDDNK